ncbi:MAG: hypothetical protein M3159_09935, partial [Actinomycetota bacterium]|nr:hypothetical protein [Actinomycetota bacterium]
IAHPVGPARTFGKYQGKAVTTAKSALSSVATVQLMADSARKSFGPYTGSVLSDSEEALTKAEGTFDSIQPPDDRADALHDELSQILTSASDHVRDVRVAARRGELGQLSDKAVPLADDSARLSDFVQKNK